MSNTFGTIFRLTSFGESHGPAIGGVLDGVPAGVKLDLEAVQRQLNRRRPGQSNATTGRDERDQVQFLSGLLDGVTTGTPIGFVIKNEDVRSTDYDGLSRIFRPSHADFTYQSKYGVRDYRGGGRASARETATRVVAGAVARQILAMQGIDIVAFTRSIGNVRLEVPYTQLDLMHADCNVVRCPDPDAADKMIQLLQQVRTQGDTVGGIVTCVISGVRVGLGQPVAGKLNAMLAAAMMSINAAKGFELGMGFEGAGRLGSQVIDPLDIADDGSFITATNYSGGIQGGISNGADIYFNVAFKPVATLMQPVPTVDIDGNKTTLNMRGRHDVCVVPRAVPVVEAMAAITILDALLLDRTTRL